jgi:hypothetical protein
MKMLALLGVLVASLAVGAIPIAAAPARLVTETVRYSYDGAGSASMVTTGTVRMAPRAVFAVVEVDLAPRKHPHAFFPEVLDLDPGDGVRTFGAVGNRELCRKPLTCHVQGDLFSFEIHDFASSDGSHQLHLRFYLAARGAKVSIKDDLVGYKAHRRSNGLITRYDTDATGAGIATSGVDVGALTGVSAPGDRAGSVAILVPGCGIGGGVGTFRGGDATYAPGPFKSPYELISKVVLCPSGPVPKYAHRATIWTAEGLMAGASTNETRLVVIDN